MLAVWLVALLVFNAVWSRAAEPVSAQVRLNQVGFASVESKSAILLAPGVEKGATFNVVDNANGKSVFTAAAGAEGGAWSKAFPATYSLDFSAVKATGEYHLEVGGAWPARSPNFRVDSAVALYAPLAAHALFFFRAQHDGANVDAEVLHRKPSHLADATASVYAPPIYRKTKLLGALKKLGGPIDVSGGWFDAADYLKFVHTTSFSAGVMLFTARQFSNAAAASEARHGLEWLLKMWDQKSRTLYYQVGIGDGNDSIRGDHDFWRLPEADDQRDTHPGDDEYFVKFRPVFRAGAPGTLVSPNIAGRMSAALALGFQVFQKSDAAFAHRCLLAAQTIFDLAQTEKVGELLTASPHEYYPETEWRDDLEWGAAELFFATNAGALPEGLPHADAQFYLRKSAHWAKANIASANHAGESLNLYDVSALAHFELHRALKGEASRSGVEVTEAALAADLKATLGAAAKRSASDPFGLGLAYTPSNDLVPHALGLAITAAFYKEMTGDLAYDHFAQSQRDWVLGKNAWGTTFVVGAGSVFPKCIDHQIANLSGHLDGTPPLLRGAVVDGPASDLSGVDGLPEGARPNPVKNDAFQHFNGKGVQYRDDVGFWPTVEPALDYTVLSLLLFAQQVSR